MPKGTYSQGATTDYTLYAVEITIPTIVAAAYHTNDIEHYSNSNFTGKKC